MVEEPKTVVVENERRSSTGLVVAVIAIILLALFLIFGLPNLTGGNNPAADVEVTAPAPVQTTE